MILMGKSMVSGVDFPAETNRQWATPMGPKILPKMSSFGHE